MSKKGEKLEKLIKVVDKLLDDLKENVENLLTGIEELRDEEKKDGEN